MSQLTRQEKINVIRSVTHEHGITAYEIAKETQLSEAGILNILNERSKRPHHNTLDTILQYLERRTTGSRLGAIEQEHEILRYLKTMHQSLTGDISVLAKGIEKTYLNSEKSAAASELLLAGQDHLKDNINSLKEVLER